MPLMLPRPTPSATGATEVQPYHLQDKQDWAVEQERQRHADALYRLGEYSVFVMMWGLVDFQAGLVQRCPICYGTSGSVQDRVSAVYNQPTKNKCPSCYGTTFAGGIRAKIVRPALWAEVDEKERQDRRGTVHPEQVSIESTWDFRMRQGDYIIRSDNSRWRLAESPARVTLRSGFLHPEQEETSITYGRIDARYEEKTTVAYSIPPIDYATIHGILTAPGKYPLDFTGFEVVNGPLIPPHATQD